MEENKKISGITPLLEVDLTITKEEFVFLQRIKQFFLIHTEPFTNSIAFIEGLEQKYLTEGKCTYFYDTDLVTAINDKGEEIIDPRTGKTIPVLRKDFFKETINPNQN